MIKYFLVVILCCFIGFPSLSWSAIYYVAPYGRDDVIGIGSVKHPWKTITHALDSVEDGSVIEVQPGTYTGRVHIRGTFSKGVTVRSQVPYKARLRNNGTVITAYADARGVRGITLEGFDIAHSGSGAAALVVHIDGNGNNTVNNITLKNNIFHDSYNNDLLKINNSCTKILVKGNMFYNQSGSDEHIDINSASDVTVEDNIFFNWQGSTGTNFILVGEDGKPFYEAFDVMVENNLLLGNSANVMRAPFGVKGCRDITFRNNTISGDLPSLAYGMRLNRERENPANKNIRFYNNVWDDQTGTMGAEKPSRPNDFSDTPPEDTTSFVLENNLYWNGGTAIPEDPAELINPGDDPSRLIADPLLPAPRFIVLPIWHKDVSRFADNSATIAQVFHNLVAYAIPAKGSPLIDHAEAAFVPVDDILGNIRPLKADIGAFELGALPPTVGGLPSGRYSIAPMLLLLRH